MATSPWLRTLTASTDVALAIGVGLLIVLLVAPLPVLLLDAGLALSVTLSVLVQNRRKDNSKVLVFGARVQLVSFPSTTEAFRVGRSEMDRFHTFDNGGCVWSRFCRVVMRELTQAAP